MRYPPGAAAPEPGGDGDVRKYVETTVAAKIETEEARRPGDSVEETGANPEKNQHDEEPWRRAHVE